MSDLTNPEVQKDINIQEPYGLRVIGTQNPEEMTREEFDNSPDLLFHGASEPFIYDPKFAYNSNFYTNNDGSATLGTAFYTTLNKLQAENYSYVRMMPHENEPLNVVELLPKNARMLDLREKTSLEKNAPVPKEFFEKWREKFVRHYKEEDKENTPWHIRSFETRYLVHLDKLEKLPDIDLRSMLWTSVDRRLTDGKYPSPPWIDLFSAFMKGKGYDGVIYIEGGEGKKGADNATYCFYNTEAINTFEGWHKKE